MTTFVLIMAALALDARAAPYFAKSGRSPASTTNCARVPLEIESHSRRLNELHALWAEMTNLFGEMGEPDAPENKLKAKKVKINFSRKRLKSKIDLHEKELDDLTAAFCTSCAPANPTPEQTTRFCEVCAELDSCQPTLSKKDKPDSKE